MTWRDRRETHDNRHIGIWRKYVGGGPTFLEEVVRYCTTMENYKRACRAEEEEDEWEEQDDRWGR